MRLENSLRHRSPATSEPSALPRAKIGLGRRPLWVICPCKSPDAESPSLWPFPIQPHSHFFVGEHSILFQLSTHCFNEVPEGADIDIRSLLQSGDCRLGYVQGLGELLLGELAGGAKFVKWRLAEARFGKESRFGTRLRTHLGPQFAEFCHFWRCLPPRSRTGSCRRVALRAVVAGFVATQQEQGDPKEIKDAERSIRAALVLHA